jgi:hypothetical protein
VSLRCSPQSRVRPGHGSLVVTRFPFQLGFTDRHVYDATDALSVPIRLVSSRSLSTGLLANIDTGSTFCVFDRPCADILGLDLTTGIEQRISTATGSFYCFGHELTLQVFDLEWQAVVYFAEPETFRINVVGRVGFLDRLQVGIVDYERLLYLGLYDQQ